MADETPSPSSTPAGWPGGVSAAARNAPETDPALATGDAWEALLDGLRRAGHLVNAPDAPANDRDRAEGWRHLAGLLRNGIGELNPGDPDHPRFSWPDGTGKWGLDCADSLYAQTPVRAGAVYRIRGNRGSVHFMGFQLLGRMTAMDDLDADSLVLDDDGGFELIVGGDEPSGAAAANWMPMPDGASQLIVRQFFYDWDTEVPSSFEIERIDDGRRRGRPPAPPGAIVAQLEALGTFVHDNTAWWARISAEKRAQVNTFPDDGGGLGAASAGSQKFQSFGIGYFLLADDETLVIEVTPPTAKYWSIHLGNYWMESMDFINHQSSLNGHQAIIDDDGVFRAVVCRADPGVANWLDTTGLREGSMIYRWNQADGSPIPAARVVKLADLPDELPAETREVDPNERAAMAGRRREHVRRRYGRRH